ncbi:FecR family protein [Pseudomonas sp.]|uniref:FecR family protein n=1 Tax=Pseudomonas sp. TaxID=306 RepID=UPI003CC59E61
MTSQHPTPRNIREQAAEWAVLLSDGPLNAEQQATLTLWLEADPRHAKALHFARGTWVALAQAPAQQAQPRRQRSAAQRPRPAQRRSRVRRWAAAACVFAMLGGLGWSQQQRIMLPLIADHHTAAGEVRSLTLADGSEVLLDSASAIRVNYSSAQRQVELLAGAAIFQVAAQADRPFVVAADGGTTRALGTRFVVQRQDDGAALVGVLEHSVEVTSGGHQWQLAEGESLRYDAQGLSPQALDLPRLTSWQRGLLVFDRTPLAQAVAQLNHYRAGHILIADQALGQREVSGVIRLDDLDNALSTLTREMDLRQLQMLVVTLVY